MNFSELKLLINASADNDLLSDSEVMQWCNTPSITRQVETMLTTRSLMSQLGPVVADTILTKLEAASAGNSLLARTLAMMQPSEGGVDFGHASTRYQIDALVLAEILDQTEGDALKSLGDQLVSPAVNAGLGAVTEAQITYARSL